jgi:hypothetical protein
MASFRSEEKCSRQEFDILLFQTQEKYKRQQSKGFSWIPVAHACNPSYSEAEIRRIAVQS